MRVNTKQEWIDIPSGSLVDISYPTSELRRGRFQGGGKISPTITCNAGGVVYVEYEDETR